jgi:hypothetical protein
MDVEARVATITEVVGELIALVEQLNDETFEELRGEFPRIPPRPREAGYSEAAAALRRLREELASSSS